MNQPSDYSGHIVRVSRGPIAHYGIIAEDGTIWEHGGKDCAGVRAVTLPEFSRGTPVDVVMERSTLISPREAVARFKSTALKPYGIFCANCEHRARWAVLGTWTSEQTNNVGTGAVIGALVGALICKSDDLKKVLASAAKVGAIGAAVPLAAQIIKAGGTDPVPPRCGCSEPFLCVPCRC